MKRSALTLAIGLVASAAGAAQPSYPTLDPSGEPLRADFNRAAGKVRAIFLASPT